MTRTTDRSAALSPNDGTVGTETTRAPRFLFLGIGAGAVAIVALVLVLRGGERLSVPEQVTAAYIDAWNERDAQAVSGMTCLWLGAFTSAGDVENQFAAGPASGPFVADYVVTGTETVTLQKREVVAVRLQYVRGGDGKTREATVYVRLDDDHDPCVDVFTTW